MGARKGQRGSDFATIGIVGQWRRSEARRRQVGYDKKPWARVTGKGPWPEMLAYVEASAAYLLTMRDKVTRTWGDRPRPVPLGALNVNRIREGVGHRPRQRRVGR